MEWRTLTSSLWSIDMLVSSFQRCCPALRWGEMSRCPGVRPSRHVETPGQPVRPEGDPGRFEDFVVADFDHRRGKALAVVIDGIGDAACRRVGLVPADGHSRALFDALQAEDPAMT